jgi:hypothetical protein
MIRPRITAVLLFFVCVFARNAVMSSPADDPTDALPEELPGWRVLPDEARLYDRETLYDYIDGGAELYISYNFRRLFHRTYAPSGPSGEPEILVDVFEMATSQDAFGVFAHSRESIEREFGQGSQYTEGLLLFWKDRFYVSILASPETETSKGVVRDVARRIDEAIGKEGQVPEILSILPREGRIEESIRYFHHYIWLNSHYYVSDENLLHIDDTTEAVLAAYRSGAGRHFLLLVRYPDEESAKSAYESFTAGYLPELSGAAAVRIEDGTWTGCRLSGAVVAVVFNAPTEALARDLMESAVDQR